VDQDRRQRAIRVARQVNTAAAKGRDVDGKYHPLVHLIETKTIGGPPVGFQMRLTTDGAEYVFWMKDTLDPCGFAIFSDENGVIYQAEALR
jgi:hypothetical protein